MFRGRDQQGRVAELAATRDGCELVIDGKPARRWHRFVPLGEQRLSALEVDGSQFEELFELPEPARQALDRYAADPATEGGAPWEYLEELFSDGAIDADFGLTARGKRLIDQLRHGREGGTQAQL
jgi:hypothetical protein